MLSNVLKASTGVILCLTASLAIAETSISGFGSIVGGIVIDGDQFLADYPNTGIYDSDLSFAPDTTIGVQFKTTIDNRSDFILQLVARGAREFATSVDWAYFKYAFDEELSLQAGRKRLPLYFYSDFFDLAMAYHWIRPPSDNYTWQITSYNGVSLQYESQLENWDVLFTAYAGREDDEDNELLSFLANNVPVNEHWKNIIGIAGEFSKSNYELRFSLMSSQLDRSANSILIAEDVNQLFYGFSANIYFDPFAFYSELNRYQRSADDIYVTTYMVSLTYSIKDYTPHITYSRLEQEDKAASGDESHHTISIGVKKVLSKSSVLKIQYDNTSDDASTTTIVGDGQLLSFGIDFVF